MAFYRGWFLRMAVTITIGNGFTDWELDTVLTRWAISVGIEVLQLPPNAGSEHGSWPRTRVMAPSTEVAIRTSP